MNEFELIPLMPKRDFYYRLNRLVEISHRYWFRTISADANGDQKLLDHLWRRLRQHEAAKRRYLAN